MPKKNKYHSLESSPFYRLRTKKKLANLLFISPNDFSSLCTSNKRYRSFDEPKAHGNGTRRIDAPNPKLKSVQKRIANLLQRIQPPDYLFSPVKGRSYVDNAHHHKRSDTHHLLDIADFYPSCSCNKIAWFFRQRMQCSPDVSAILCDIVCFRDSLPQGSPCSPILAYLAYSEMWDAIHGLAVSTNCRLSVYADDITLSGDRVSGDLIWEVKRTIHRHGHTHCKKKERTKYREPVEVTGVIVKERTLLPPNRSHRNLTEAKRDLQQAKQPSDISRLTARIKGHESQRNQIT